MFSETTDAENLMYCSLCKKIHDKRTFLVGKRNKVKPISANTLQQYLTSPLWGKSDKIYAEELTQEELNELFNLPSTPREQVPSKSGEIQCSRIQDIKIKQAQIESENSAIIKKFPVKNFKIVLPQINMKWSVAK